MSRIEFREFLESEWAPENGFLGKLRYRIYDNDGFERVLQRLQQFRFDSELVEIEIVSLLWYIPLFMEWQTHHFEPGSELAMVYEKSKNQISEQIEYILGIP